MAAAIQPIMQKQMCVCVITTNYVFWMKCQTLMSPFSAKTGND